MNKINLSLAFCYSKKYFNNSCGIMVTVNVQLLMAGLEVHLEGFMMYKVQDIAILARVGWE